MYFWCYKMRIPVSFSLHLLCFAQDLGIRIPELRLFFFLINFVFSSSYYISEIICILSFFNRTAGWIELWEGDGYKNQWKVYMDQYNPLFQDTVQVKQNKKIISCQHYHDGVIYNVTGSNLSLFHAE